MTKIHDDKSDRVQDVRKGGQGVPYWEDGWAANAEKFPGMFPESMDIKRKTGKRTYGGPGKPPEVPGPNRLTSSTAANMDSYLRRLMAQSSPEAAAPGQTQQQFRELQRQAMMRVMARKIIEGGQPSTMPPWLAVQEWNRGNQPFGASTMRRYQR